ncbi:MAG: hypothetical protein KAR51_00045 [Candidatus Aenigmarchaeota archaeon]|nr:hypothetical protein [Candidatus Aenigmarchaeota archaeon]
MEMCFGIKSVEEFEKKVDDLVSDVLLSGDLLDYLNSGLDWTLMWIGLEEYIVGSLDKHGISLLDYHELWLREIFFYKIQEQTKTDLGFCKYFEPAFENRAKALLTGDYSFDSFNYCNYGCNSGDEKVMTTCSGTERDYCVFLRDEV